MLPSNRITLLALMRGAPNTVRVDNGPEFVSKAFDRWAYQNGVTLDFGRPGKPTDNPFVESFNGCLRDECLNAHWFLSLADAKSKIEAWRRPYNESRPHTALGVADTPGICPGGGPTGCRMRPGNSPSGRTRNRGPSFRRSNSTQIWRSFRGSGHRSLTIRSLYRQPCSLQPARQRRV
jgi:transposase InsO family protein